MERDLCRGGGGRGVTRGAERERVEGVVRVEMDGKECERSCVRLAGGAAHATIAAKQNADIRDVYTLFPEGIPKHSTHGDHYLPTLASSHSHHTKPHRGLRPPLGTIPLQSV